MMLNMAVDEPPRRAAPAKALKKGGGSWHQRRAALEELKKQKFLEKDGKPSLDDRMGRNKPYTKPDTRAKPYDRQDEPPVRPVRPETDEEKYQRIMDGTKKAETNWKPQRNFRVRNERDGEAKKPRKPREPRLNEDGTPMKPRVREKSGAGGGIKGTYVSSIFSEKKEDRVVEEIEEEEEEEPEVESSNAALKDASTFAGLGINERLVEALLTMNLSKPTKIQRATLPRLIQRESDLFVQAQTGSGKTLAFVLPVLARIMSCPKVTRESGLFAVILTPTRELTNQIYSVLETLCRKACPWVVPGIVIGGEKKKSEKARIRKGVNVLVATPGRLADHFDNTEALDLSQVRWVVLDEGDRLMELGFEETITKILRTIEYKSVLRGENYLQDIPADLKGLPTRRTTVLCSATMKGGVQELGKTTLKDADWVSTESVPDVHDLAENTVEKHSAPAQLIQEYALVPAKLRLVTLMGALRAAGKVDHAKVIVFMSCSDSVDYHFDVMTREGEFVGKLETAKTAPVLRDEPTQVYKLHGSLSQQARTATLASFTKNDAKMSILLCTDVASRGLDLPMISNVVEYDPPFSVEDHLHRVGRTARAGQEGRALLFLLPGPEEGYVEKLKQSQNMRKTTYENILAAGFGGKGWDFAATNYHLDIERWLLGDEDALDKARRGFTSHIRAYATHVAAEREMFNVRLLHLGHLAKSFGLREAPGKLGKKKDPEIVKVHKDGSLDEEQAKRKMIGRARRHVTRGGEEAMGGYQLS